MKKPLFLRSLPYKSLLVSSIAAGSVAIPAVAQEREALTLEEVVVSARRREEKLQDVPISMTVLTQQQVKNANITNAGDIALYTPSLTTNNRFGDDLTSFAIRGFTQELRTTASVGVYFADVVSPRGSNSQVSGDGAGPGLMFDLENIQVLKGPQGTLFGRNTTGGAVLLVPKKPTDELGGYIEASVGNYDLRQVQGVLNVPMSDKVRFRFGFDSKERDGHLNNVGDVGPDDFGNVDYIAARASLVIDITDTLENYTILSYTDSENNGTFPVTNECLTTAEGGAAFGGFLGDLCQAQLDRQAAAGDDDFYDTAQVLPNPTSELEDWRIINTTKWEITDNLTLKNIISYSELNTINNSPIWGNDFQFAPFMNPSNTIPFAFASSGARGDGTDITDSSTFVEEIQLQGLAFDSRLTWQAGLYYEKTEPEDSVGQSSPSNIACDFASLESGNPNDWRCNDVFAGAAVLGLINSGTLPQSAYGNEAAFLGAPLRVGSISLTTDELEYTNKAAYMQGTFDFSEQLSVTAGLRYTDDETTGSQERLVYRFAYDPLFGTFAAPESVTEASPKQETAKSDEFTWLLGVDYKPNDSTLLYGKYTRGYRQGSVNVSSQPGLLVHGPEQVDTYEIGSKMSFDGAVRGTFNVALFYNDLQDQQLQNGLLLSQEFGGVGSTAIVNAGESSIFGLEMDTSLQLFEGFILSASYAYLDTEVKEIKDVNDFIIASGATPSTLSAVEGDELPFTPEHSATVSANYRLPLSHEIGDIVVGATYVYTDEMRMVSSASGGPYEFVPSFEIVNLNMNWSQVAGSNFDLSLFVNNVFEEEYYTYATGSLSSLEYDSALPGQPRIYGMRLKYSFGGEAN